MSRKYTRIYQASGEHDANCTRALQVSPRKLRFRVTRPDPYPVNSPGHLDVSARQGHYTDACCAVQAARIIIRRLALDDVKPDSCCDACCGTGKRPTHQGPDGNAWERCTCVTDNVRVNLHEQPLDVEVWQ